MARNIGFLLKHVPFAAKKAEVHFNKAIEISKKIGAKAVAGEAYFDLGLLYGARGRVDLAHESISNAIRLFEQCEAEVFLRQAKEALEQLHE
jgi:tetratricopeptide (TPR) repeat protein